MKKNIKIKKIQEYINYLGESYKEGLGTSVPKVEKVENYNKKRKDIGYEYFILSGDKHYFSARILFLYNIGEYSMFCGQQCIENYLKAYQKYKNITPQKDIHDIEELLRSCRAKNTKNFITSKEIEIIVKKYNPFYENTRYPVQKKRPKNGQYTIFYPFDIEVLDYFVLKMREVMPYPNNMIDILKDPYLPIEEKVFNMFKKDNVYYMS